MLPAVLYLLLRYYALGYLLGGSPVTELLNDPYLEATTTEKLATNLMTWGKYLLLLLIPHPLTHDYYPMHFPLTGFDNPLVLASIAIYLFLAFIAIRGLRQKKLLSFAILYYFITFSISSNVLFNVGTFMNERFMFAPSMGYAMAISMLMLAVTSVRKQSRTIPVSLLSIVTLVLVLYSVKVISRNRAWYDDYTLFTTDVKVSENSIKCNVSAAGKTLERYEETEKDKRDPAMLDQAIIWLNKALKMHPSYLAGWEQYGKAVFYKEDFRKAFTAYQNCLRIRPNYQTARRNMGLVATAAFNKGSFDMARDFILDMNRMQISTMEDSLTLAYCYVNLEVPDSATALLREILLRDPRNYDALNKMGELSARYYNNLPAAENFLQQAIDVDPAIASAWENMGIVKAMQRDLKASLFYFEKALSLDPENARIMGNLSTAYQSMGNKAKADEMAEKARQAESAGPGQ
jgi:tetratricopeptide (TPR) repeat protein